MKFILKAGFIIAAFTAVLGLGRISSAELLGVTVFPGTRIEIDAAGTMNYTPNSTASTGTLLINAFPTLAVGVAPPDVFNIFQATPGNPTVTIVIEVDKATGDLVGSGTFTLTGTLFTSHVPISGTLLTGDVFAFGFRGLNTDGTDSLTDEYDFLFTVSGGQFASSFGDIGAVVGITAQSPNSDFVEDFTVNFSGEVDGTVSPPGNGAGLLPDPPASNLEHFLSYKLKRTEFEKLEVTLTDQFESDVLFEVKKPKELYNPADKNGEGIIDLNTHLVGYKIKRARTDPPQPKHVERANIEVVNQFGTIFVDTKKPDRLLVPSSKSLEGPVDSLEGETVDHFKCYRVVISRGNPRFERIEVFVEDQFEQPKEYVVKRPTRLCNPVEKRVEVEGGEQVTEIENPDQHLMCYKVKRAEGEPKHVKLEGIHTNNQFGPLQLDTKKEKELCVPSTMVTLGDIV